MKYDIWGIDRCRLFGCRLVGSISLMVRVLFSMIGF